MANSRYEYVKAFEQPDKLLPNTWIVVRIDGRGFTKMCSKYNFEKPNDRRGIDLMNAAAVAVMRDVPDLVLAYGVSDEYSFLFPKECKLFDRREGKIVSTIVSTYSAYYVHLWPEYFPDYKLSPPLPSFDGRAVLYPDLTSLRDYFSWRQVDCHINNLYNTSFWSLVLKGGMTAIEAEARLSGTLSGEKNEILFSQFGINYNNEPEIYKKGSVIYRDLRAGKGQDSQQKAASEGGEDGSGGMKSPVAELQPQPESISHLSQTHAPSAETQEPGTGTASMEPSLPAQTVIPDAASKPTGKANQETKFKPGSKRSQIRAKKLRQRAPVVIEHVDIIQDEFWNRRPWILSPDLV